MQFLDEATANDPAWAEPIFSVQRALEHSTCLADRFVEPTDFLHRGKVLRSGRPDIFLFQHFYTGRYINLDADGHATCISHRSGTLAPSTWASTDHTRVFARPSTASTCGRCPG